MAEASAAFKIGRDGQSFDGVVFDSKVTVVFEPDLSGCVVELDEACDTTDLLNRLADTAVTDDGESLWTPFKPKLASRPDDTQNTQGTPQQQPLDAADKPASGKPPGTLVHRYTLDRENFEVYAGPVHELAYVARRCQLFVSVLSDAEETPSLDVEPDKEHNQYAWYTAKVGTAPADEGENPEDQPGKETDTPDDKDAANQSEPAPWEIVGYARGTEEYLYPLARQLVIHDLFVVPPRQRKGHGSVLTACVWEHAKRSLPQIARVTWSPAENERAARQAKRKGAGAENQPEDEAPEQESGIPQVAGFKRVDRNSELEDFARPVHLARMLKEGVFVDYTPGQPLNADAYDGDPYLTKWEKTRRVKDLAAKRIIPGGVPSLLVWSRAGAEVAARALLLPVATVRELFEVCLLRKTAAAPDAKAKEFVMRRLYQMDWVGLKNTRATQILNQHYRETAAAWARTNGRATALKRLGILP
eukprot:gene6616-10126_t